MDVRDLEDMMRNMFTNAVALRRLPSSGDLDFDGYQGEGCLLRWPLCRYLCRRCGR